MRVIAENNVPANQSCIIESNDACIEMETGTGKTLTYIQTAYELYKEYVGCSIEKPLEFLGILNDKNIPVILRQVIIPSLNDNEENIKALSAIAKKYPNVKKIELLPFKKLCYTKYENLNIPFRFGDLPEPSREKMQELKNLL